MQARILRNRPMPSNRPIAIHYRASIVWRCFVLALAVLGLCACQPAVDPPGQDWLAGTAEGELSFVAVEPAAVPASEPAGTGRAAFTVLGATSFAVVERVTLVNHGPGAPDKHNLWVALISTVAPYQEVEAIEITPAGFHLFTDEQGNRYAEFDFSNMPAGSRTVVEIRYRVTVNELAYDLATCTGAVPEGWTEAELHIESDNPQIRGLASDLSQGQADACWQLRAIYDHIGDTLTYTYNGEQWGAQAALGPMGADCTEYAALMAALSRAVGLPARYLEGVAYLTEADASLGRAEHAWLEVYLPGIGWAPMDPTFGRLPTLRDTYFAHLPPDHIIVTRGASPSALRGSSYFTHLYWPGDSADISIEEFSWTIEPMARQH